MRRSSSERSRGAHRALGDQNVHLTFTFVSFPLAMHPARERNQRTGSGTPTLPQAIPLNVSTSAAPIVPQGEKRGRGWSFFPDNPKAMPAVPADNPLAQATMTRPLEVGARERPHESTTASEELQQRARTIHVRTAGENGASVAPRPRQISVTRDRRGDSVSI